MKVEAKTIFSILWLTHIKVILEKIATAKLSFSLCEYTLKMLWYMQTT